MNTISNNSNNKGQNSKFLMHWQVVTFGLIIYDFVAVCVAYFLALWIRFDCKYSEIPLEYLAPYFKTILIYALAVVVVFWFLRLYKSIWRFASYNELLRVCISSSIQATLAGRFGNSEYGRSKKAGEELFFDYANETGAKVAVYRFPNLMGHSRPKYNSAVSTFCWAVANDEEFTVNDSSTELELLYIDDLVEGMFDLIEGKEKHCEFDGVETVIKADGKYCCVPVTHKVTLGEIVDLLQQFKEQPTTLMMPKMPEGSFAKKLYSLYLTYLPTEKFKYALKMNVDNRGSFTELVHTQDCGQVSINISRPGITKGQHWHNSKWELFIVVAGHGLIQERNINTGEKVEFEVSGDKIEAIHMIPGWTHNIINLSETENLVTVMTCNEIFNPERPDTFFEEV